METETQPSAENSAPARKKSPLRLILICGLVIILLLLGGLFAYGKFVRHTSSVTEIFSTSRLNPNCKYNDPDLCKFINNWKDVKDITITSTITDKDKKTSTMVMKMEGEDKTQYSSEESGKENYNTITIGDTTYTKDYSDNKWFKSTYSANTNLGTNDTIRPDFDQKAAEAEDKTTYKKIGTEKCDKMTCFKYQVIDPAITDSTEYIFFDNKEYLLRKTRSESADGATTESIFNYDKVSISAPSPTKEGSPYDFSTGAGTTLPTNSNTSVSNESMNEYNSIVNSNISASDHPTEPTNEEDVYATPDQGE